MKHFLLFLFGISVFYPLFPQSDTRATGTIAADFRQTNEERLKLNIFPVPFRDGNFTITSDKEISALRITNVIGQEVYKSTFGIPVNEIKVSVPNAGRGIYIIIIVFSDNTKAVRRISSEGNSS
ncbi:MAG TPA: T9SS type A sorting domain-containing protein [Bacteroidales bacterium]|nr:T9SS type A sorting domain-containing protein [Bacteroidales bacterium]HRT89031.1 T9SS type A sorting domain-containing protein [Bacteroidales bacterium]